MHFRILVVKYEFGGGVSPTKKKFPNVLRPTLNAFFDSVAIHHIFVTSVKTDFSVIFFSISHASINLFLKYSKSSFIFISFFPLNSNSLFPIS